MSTDTEKSNPPFLRNGDDLALWPAKDDSKALLSGHITLGGEKRHVFAFLNDTDRDGTPLDHPYLSFSSNVAPKGEAAQWKTIAYGNAINSRKDDKPVYYDQLVINAAGDRETTCTAFVARGCPPEFQAKLGFAQAVIPRPEKTEPKNAESHEPEAECPTP